MAGRPWRVIGACYLVRALVGAAIALPWAVAVAAEVGAYPRGDGVLWQQGGVLLVETGRLLRPIASTLVARSAGVALVGVFLSLVPLGALVALAACPTECPWRATLRCYGSFALLQGFVMVLQSLALASAWWVFGMLRFGLDEYETYRVAALVFTVAGAAGFMMAAAHDVVRVQLLREDDGVMRALDRCFELTWRQWRSLLGAAAWRALCCLGLLLGGLGCLLVAGVDGGSMATALFVQLVTLSCILIRYSWLLRACTVAAR